MGYPPAATTTIAAPSFNYVKKGRVKERGKSNQYWKCDVCVYVFNRVPHRQFMQQIFGSVFCWYRCIDWTWPKTHIFAVQMHTHTLILFEHSRPFHVRMQIFPNFSFLSSGKQQITTTKVAAADCYWCCSSFSLLFLSMELHVDGGTEMKKNSSSFQHYH